MHELGVIIGIFELIEEIMKEQQLKKVSSVTVEVGELSSIMPEYFKECWHVAGIGGAFEKTQLIVDFVPAVARCACGTEYEMQKNSRICPVCKGTDYEIIRGREFSVKQIEAC